MTSVIYNNKVEKKHTQVMMKICNSFYLFYLKI